MPETHFANPKHGKVTKTQPTHNKTQQKHLQMSKIQPKHNQCTTKTQRPTTKNTAKHKSAHTLNQERKEEQNTPQAQPKHNKTLAELFTSLAKESERTTARDTHAEKTSAHVPAAPMWPAAACMSAPGPCRRRPGRLHNEHLRSAPPGPGGRRRMQTAKSVDFRERKDTSRSCRTRPPHCRAQRTRQPQAQTAQTLLFFLLL